MNRRGGGGKPPLRKTPCVLGPAKASPSAVLAPPLRLGSTWLEIMTVIRRPARTAQLDLAMLQREVHQLLERLSDLDRADPPSDGNWMPSIDVYECRGKLMVVAEVPGMAPESLRVTFRDRHLAISGERRERR